MKSLYTETFQEFLNNNENNETWNTFKNRLISEFPAFQFGNVTLSLYSILEKKFIYREIGRETEDLFVNSLDKKLDEVVIKYSHKVKLFLENADDLMTFKFDVSDTEKYTDYLNPTTADTENLNVDSVSKREHVYERFLAPLSSRPDLIDKIQGITSIYYKAVNEFEDCFMGCF